MNVDSLTAYKGFEDEEVRVVVVVGASVVVVDDVVVDDVVEGSTVTGTMVCVVLVFELECPADKT